MRKIFCDRCKKEIKGNAFEIIIHEKPDAFGRSTANDMVSNIISNQNREMKEYCEECVILVNRILENEILGMTAGITEMAENDILIQKGGEYVEKLAAAEKALDIKLTPIQKQYLVFPHLRRTGKTTAKIIDILISENKNTKIFLHKEDLEEYMKTHSGETIKTLTIEDFIEPELENNMPYREILRQQIIEIYRKLKIADIEVPKLFLKAADIKIPNCFLREADKEGE